VFVEYEAKVTCRVSGVKKRVMYCSKLLFKSMIRNSVLEELKS